jgi:hypothetical protein
VPQGGGDVTAGYRCPGDVIVAMVSTLTIRLARLDYVVPGQDPTISLRRIPALRRSRFVMRRVRPATVGVAAVAFTHRRIGGRRPTAPLAACRRPPRRNRSCGAVRRRQAATGMCHHTERAC